MMYEFGTIELSGEDNMSSRAGWSTLLSAPTLTDGTEITTFNFTKGNDGWDPLPALIANDSEVGLKQAVSSSGIHIFTQANRIFITNIKSKTKIDVYSLNGILVKSFETSEDTSFDMKAGLWIVRGSSKEGTGVAKILKK